MSLRTVAAPPAIRTAVVMTHSDAADTAAAVAAAVAAAERSGCRLYAGPEEREKHAGPSAGLEPLDELREAPDLCLVLGGDGTILRALGTYGARQVPVFGVNYGTIGFLAAAERSDLEQGLELALSGSFEVVELPGLDVEIGGHARVAHNDVSFTRRPHARVAELSYRLGGQEVGHVRCDGLVAATPTGSTGYNLANSGPILAWGVEGYVVSFVAPHTLTARALVVAPDDVLHVRNEGRRDAVDVALDGGPAGELEPEAEIGIRFRPTAGRLAQLPGSNFYRRMRDKFGRLAQ
jgi:NAD+ kinase